MKTDSRGSLRTVDSAGSTHAVRFYCRRPNGPRRYCRFDNIGRKPRGA